MDKTTPHSTRTATRRVSSTSEKAASAARKARGLFLTASQLRVIARGFGIPAGEAVGSFLKDAMLEARHKS